MRLFKHFSLSILILVTLLLFNAGRDGTAHATGILHQQHPLITASCSASFDVGPTSVITNIDTVIEFHYDWSSGCGGDMSIVAHWGDGQVSTDDVGVGGGSGTGPLDHDWDDAGTYTVVFGLYSSNDPNALGFVDAQVSVHCFRC